MKEVSVKTKAYGHFSIAGRLEIRGEHCQMEKRLVLISFIEGKNNSELHIYLSPDDAEKISVNLKIAADKTRLMK
jgi:hypothetical protein